MVIDTRKMEMRKKRVRPLNMQADFESRKLWYHVTKSLELGDINVATEHKKYVSESTKLLSHVVYCVDIMSVSLMRTLRTPGVRIY